MPPQLPLPLLSLLFAAAYCPRCCAGGQNEDAEGGGKKQAETEKASLRKRPSQFLALAQELNQALSTPEAAAALAEAVAPATGAGEEKIAGATTAAPGPDGEPQEDPAAQARAARNRRLKALLPVVGQFVDPVLESHDLPPGILRAMKIMTQARDEMLMRVLDRDLGEKLRHELEDIGAILTAEPHPKMLGRVVSLDKLAANFLNEGTFLRNKALEEARATVKGWNYDDDQLSIPDDYVKAMEGIIGAGDDHDSGLKYLVDRLEIITRLEPGPRARMQENVIFAFINDDEVEEVRMKVHTAHMITDALSKKKYRHSHSHGHAEEL